MSFFFKFRTSRRQKLGALSLAKKLCSLDSHCRIQLNYRVRQGVMMIFETSIKKQQMGRNCVFKTDGKYSLISAVCVAFGLWKVTRRVFLYDVFIETGCSVVATQRGKTNSLSNLSLTFSKDTKSGSIHTLIWIIALRYIELVLVFIQFVQKHEFDVEFNVLIHICRLKFVPIYGFNT